VSYMYSTAHVCVQCQGVPFGGVFLCRGLVGTVVAGCLRAVDCIARTNTLGDAHINNANLDK